MGDLGMRTTPVIKPKQRLVLSMHPFLKIEPNENGTGGGITLRVFV